MLLGVMMSDFWMVFTRSFWPCYMMQFRTCIGLQNTLDGSHCAGVCKYRPQPFICRCIPLLLNQPNREELLDVLVDAGESAWARGAHEA